MLPVLCIACEAWSYACCGCKCNERVLWCCRWAGYASFATTLALMVVGTVVTRTGVLPPIKGLDIFAF